MTSNALISNESSSLYQALVNSGTENLSYATDLSAPILSRSYIELQPQQSITASPSGKEQIFYCVKGQILENAVLKFVLTKSAGTMDNTRKVGLQIPEWIELRSNNKTIERMTSQALRAKLSCRSSDFKLAVHRISLPLVPGTDVVAAVTDTAVECYCPIISTFFENSLQNLDLGRNEQLSVVVRYAVDGPTMGFEAASSVTALSASLWVWQRQYDPIYLDKIRSLNYKAGSFLSMLCTNTYTESFPCVNSTTNIVRLRNNYVVKSLHFAVLTVDGVVQPINNTTLKFGGTSLIQTAPQLIMNYDKQVHGGSSNELISAVAVQRQANEFTTIHFGYDPSNFVKNSGAVSFGDLNAVELTIITPTAPATTSNIFCVVEYFNFVSISENGIMNISQAY
jgi:hypothetical protein